MLHPRLGPSLTNGHVSVRGPSLESGNGFTLLGESEPSHSENLSHRLKVSNATNTFVFDATRVPTLCHCTVKAFIIAWRFHSRNLADADFQFYFTVIIWSYLKIFLLRSWLCVFTNYYSVYSIRFTCVLSCRWRATCLISCQDSRISTTHCVR